LSAAGAPQSQRIDKWLWCARFVKTRALAAGQVKAGPVRRDGPRLAGPDKPVRPGDILTVALARTVLVVRVRSVADRRGPASEAQLMYEPVEPPAPDRAPP
jgi:ribosome-associated heat shock protein Hsp15